MTDRKISELTESPPQDADSVPVARTSNNFRWTGLGLRTWLESFFTTLSAFSGHTGAANPHSGSASSTDLTNHTSAANPHSGSLSTSHEGAGGAVHPTATSGVNGFMANTDKSKLDSIEPAANNYSHPNHTGDVTSSGDGAQTIANDAVTNAKLANVTANTIKGRATTTGDPTDIDIEALADGGTPAATDVILGKKDSGDLVKFLGANIGGVGGGVGVEDEGGSLGTFDTLNFVGGGVTATDAGGGTANVTIPGGSGGGDMSSPATIAIGELYEAANTDGTQTARSNVLAANLATMAANGTNGNLIQSAGNDKTQADSGLAASTVVGHIGSGDIHTDHTAVSITAGNGLTGGGTIAATRTLDVGAGDGITANANDVAVDATVARLNAAADFTVSLDEAGVPVIWSPFTIWTTGTQAHAFRPGSSPHIHIDGTVTVDPPTDDDGIVGVTITAASTVSISGSFDVEIGSRTAGKAQTATMKRINSAGTPETWFTWGPAAA